MLPPERITFVSTYAPDHCGLASYTDYLSQALLATEESVQVSVVTPTGGRSSEERLEVVPYESASADYSTIVERTIAATRPDIVHIQHEYGIFGADDRFLRLLSRLTHLGCPVVVTMHTVHTNLSVDLGCGWTRGFSMEGLSIEPYQCTMGELADLIVVHHDRSARQTLIRQGLDGRKVAVIPHGTLLTEGGYSPQDASGQVPAGRPLLVAPGYFRRSKNAETVIEAFAAIAEGRPDATLWISGYVRGTSGEALAYVDSLLARAAEAGVADQVILGRAPLSESAMTSMLESADVVLCVYDEDTRSASGILHRAIGAGATVVASRRPKFQELADACDELLVDPDRPAELARLVNRILDDSAFTRAVRQPLRELAQRTAWPEAARAHLDAYAVAAAGRRARGHHEQLAGEARVDRELHELSSSGVR